MPFGEPGPIPVGGLPATGDLVGRKLGTVLMNGPSGTIYDKSNRPIGTIINGTIYASPDGRNVIGHLGPGSIIYDALNNRVGSVKDK